MRLINWRTYILRSENELKTSPRMLHHIRDFHTGFTRKRTRRIDNKESNLTMANSVWVFRNYEATLSLGTFCKDLTFESYFIAPSLWTDYIGSVFVISPHVCTWCPLAPHLKIPSHLPVFVRIQLFKSCLVISIGTKQQLCIIFGKL